MAGMRYSTTYNGLFGFLIGYGTRRGYDAHNRMILMDNYKRTGEIPKKKSLAISLLLALLFGGFGLFYISPRVAVPFTLMEILMFPIFVGVLNILARPLILFFALIATLSYNRMILNLFGRYGVSKK